MKNKYKILRLPIIILLVFISTSCESDFLDKNPLDSVSSQGFWNTKADVETGLAGVYSRLQQNFLGYERIYFEGLTDNAYCEINFNQRYIFEMTLGNISPSTGGAINNMYSSPYRAITSCNLFLDNVDNAKDNILPAQLDIYKAEVRFIRALCYFDLVQLFGEVPVYKKYFTKIEEGKIAKSSKAEIYTFIEEDLNFAIAKLPDTKYSGHAVKGSAQALLGRVLLTQEKWPEAATVLNDIIIGLKFQLSNSYKDLFLIDGQANAAVNREIMFSTNYALGNPQRLSPQSAGYEVEMANWALLQPFKDFADSYQMTDGNSSSTSPLDNTNYANRDPRLGMTMKLPNETWKNPTTQVSQIIDNPSITGFIMEKYVDLSKIPISGATAPTSHQDYIHLRYADVLLMYAEAKNEATGPDGTVYSAINEVRARATVNMPAVVQADYNTKELLREYIRNERRVELAMEGLRYFDLKRWKIAEAKLNGVSTVGTQPMQFLPKHYYLPLAQSEIDRNPKLEQNLDYK
ncbi:RagB/SusD family nutrient uptake outer membrane protein [Mariniflexile litorale]|uniref:RagB/SusD family nutrient uptake outer membrane protein n=1 Tax=Mariniflexile litorale TaxID=3045158 RepID=A0AAU7EBN8_9FLAO|nr:RagB/SusD family nutrient uptake outer membrane protein [Mariniflexile sp. KMM 9835]MDQ8212893.1 RagB/SusD family nutrient uptake outer membrane protein [Mariniflexile sp. KMM 9835]